MNRQLVLFTWLLRHAQVVSKWHEERIKTIINNASGSTSMEKKKEDKPSEVLELPYSYLDEDGVRILTLEKENEIYISHCAPKGFVSFKCSAPSAIAEGGCVVYTASCLDRYYSSILSIEQLLDRHADIMYELSECVLPARQLPNYLKTIKCFLQMNPGYDGSFMFKNDDKSNLFFYRDLYKSFKWTSELIDKYKDHVDWVILIEGEYIKDLINEEFLDKYYDYSPFKNRTEKYGQQIVIQRYDLLGEISFSFICNHLNDFNIYYLLTRGHFKLTPEELLLLNERISQIKDNHSGGISSLASNDFFEWSPDLLEAFGRLNPYYWRLFENKDDKKRKQIYEMILRIPSFQEIISSMKSEDEPEYYLMRLKDGSYQSYLGTNKGMHALHKNHAYSDLFHMETIKENLRKWDQVVDDVFLYNHRECTDHTYYVRQVYTYWNLFCWNENVRLNYEIAKYLSDKTITIGGEYEIELRRQENPDYGYKTKSINALEFFIRVPFDNHDEIEKVLEDDSLLFKFLDGGNQSVISYVLDSFFRDYSYDEYVSLIKDL